MLRVFRTDLPDTTYFTASVDEHDAIDAVHRAARTNGDRVLMSTSCSPAALVTKGLLSVRFERYANMIRWTDRLPGAESQHRPSSVLFPSHS